MRDAARSILISQAFLYVGLAGCVLLKPSGLAANDGISYYGIYRETFLPYAIGLLGAAYWTTRAVNQLPSDERLLQLAFRVYVLLIVGIVITPYTAGRWLDYLHITCGATLFSLQLLLSGWLVQRLRYAWWGLLLALTMLISGLFSAIYLEPAHGFLFQTQVLFQVAFGMLLMLSLPELVRHQRRPAQPEVGGQ